MPQEKKTQKTKKINKDTVIKDRDKDIEAMLKAGLHFGHSKDNKHAKMGPFIYGVRNNVLLIDILQTKEYLQEALNYLKQKKKEGGVILFVGTKVVAKNMIKELAESIKMPYVIDRWLGGTLTNFEILKDQIKKLEEMEERKKKGEFKELIKKEKFRREREMESIRRKIGGLRTLKKLPDILFVVDVNKERTAIQEAKKQGITIVGICDTNGDPKSVDFPIPANDDAPLSLKYILEKVKKI